MTSEVHKSIYLKAKDVSRGVCLCLKGSLLDLEMKHEEHTI